MSVTANPLTSPIVREPARRTLYCATVLNNCCTWSVVEGWTPDELEAKILGGQAAGIYGGTVREYYEREAIDPGEWAAYRAELSRIERTTCPLPDEHDLLLRIWAKQLPPERCEEIDPEAAHGRQTAAALKEIKNAAFNNILRRHWFGESSTPRGATCI